MPAERLSMRKIREILRLSFGGKLSPRSVAQSCGMGRTTVREYLERTRRAGLSWPLPEGLTDEGLEQRLFASGSEETAGPRFLPNWTEIHQQLRRKGVTLRLVWEEYKQSHPDGLQYTQFCVRYRAWRSTLDLPMRQEHKAGEKMFVDYCGQTVPVTDQKTGEVRQTQVFMAVLGASNYTYAEASWSQSLPEWCAAHVHAFQYYGGVPALVIPRQSKGRRIPCAPL